MNQLLRGWQTRRTPIDASSADVIKVEHPTRGGKTGHALAFGSGFNIYVEQTTLELGGRLTPNTSRANMQRDLGKAPTISLWVLNKLLIAELISGRSIGTRSH